MAILELGTVRMVHRFGGPEKVLSCCKNGQAVFVSWPLNGLIRIVLKTGKLWDNRMGPWAMHPDDLKRIATNHQPYAIRPKLLSSSKRSST